MTTIKFENMIIRAKIDLLEPICNSSGTFYYAGFINDIYTHFLSYDRLSKKSVKVKLLKRFLASGYLLKKEDEQRGLV